MPRSALARSPFRDRPIQVEVLESRRLLAATPVLQIATGSIAGIVHAKTGLAGITVELLDDAKVVATTRTDAAGQYRFENVWPGLYDIREGESPLLAFADIEVQSGDELTGYDFSELPLDSIAAAFSAPAKIEQPSPAVAFPFAVPVASQTPVPRVIDQVAAREAYFPSSVDGISPQWQLRVLKGPLAKSPGKLMQPASVSTNSLRAGKWVLSEGQESSFGSEGATPLAGDFDGDGRSELGVYLDGEWSIDANHNGRRDDEDVTIHWGSRGEQPVVGDWNGDGRKDIGVYRGADGVPVAGDFTGRGRDSIGLFQGGKWQLDLDGDGSLTAHDPIVQFGESGDLPVVGDFDGDGRDEIGVFRNGKWIIDSNHNGQIDAADKVFELGGAGDLPIVGDFDGDGIDEPGLYRGSPAARISRTR